MQAWNLDPFRVVKSPMKEETTTTSSDAEAEITATLNLQDQPEADRLSGLLEHVSLLTHLATFGIIGVLVRYGLEKLFGPTLGRVTDLSSALFIDLPANMLGCFFMGWVGIAVKPHLTGISDHLALGLSSGLMGSITTFASWSQSMLRIITAGYWVRGLVGFLLGLELAITSLIIGIDTANFTLTFMRQTSSRGTTSSSSRKTNKMAGLVLFATLSAGLWMMAFSLLFREQSYERKKLWLACTLAPLGVWSRWWLSSLNGRGLRRGSLVWLPIGTLLANVCASAVEFLLNILQLLRVIKNRQLVLVSAGFQFGMLGCMSTVSTLVAEIYWLHQQQQDKWRAYAYASITILVTLVFGLVSFSAVAWLTGVSVHV